MTNKKRMWSEDEINFKIIQAVLIASCLILIIVALFIAYYDSFLVEPAPTTDQILSEAGWTYECVERETFSYCFVNNCPHEIGEILIKNITEEKCEKIIWSNDCVGSWSSHKQECTKYTWLPPKEEEHETISPIAHDLPEVKTIEYIEPQNFSCINLTEGQPTIVNGEKVYYNLWLNDKPEVFFCCDHNYHNCAYSNEDLSEVK